MEFNISAKPRVILGRQNKTLRKSGTMPAVLYGAKTKSLPLQVNQRDFEKIFRQAGENTLINLEVEGEGVHKVLIHDVAKHFMKNEPIHVDFYEVDLSKKIHATVPLHFVGTSVAVKELGGILIKSLNQIQVEALPTDLPQFLEVTIEKLSTFEDLIRVAEIPVNEKIRILDDPEAVIVSVQPPRTEAELADLEKPTADEEKAVIEGMTKETPVAEGEVSEESGDADKPEKTEK